MDRKNAENLINEAFNFPFEKNNFTKLVSNIFKTSISSKIEQVPIDKNFENSIQKINHYADFIDEGEKKIHALEIELDDKYSYEKSRSFQRNIAINYLKKNDCDAIIVSFHNSKSEDWRFSLITREINANIDNKGNIKINISTSPLKRLSFLVGKNEPNFTAKTQIIKLLLNKKNELEDIRNAFNLEKVTEEFFDDYKNLYIDLSKEIKRIINLDNKINKDFNEKNINEDNFSKKLLGQIVFLYFLQKKGWLGVEKNENGNFQKWGSGSKTFLQDLFNNYEQGKYNAQNFFNNILEPIFYDALNNEEEYYDKFDCKIPFLNGGLFKPFNDYNWSETDILIDDKIIKKIFITFDRYNFTVQEDQNFDSDVAVDPEMLGKVFENLLPENLKKGKGSFYTPREVVSFMCKQSIKNYLLNNRNFNEEKLITLLSTLDNDENKKDIFSTSDLKIIDSLLENIKICDPAIGSGAFPVQFMNEIVTIRMFISDNLKLDYSQYLLKRNFIENSIYGVDIDSSAIEIAKLRLWLSLIIDEKSFDKIDPLPNLDYKILQGNSLIQSYENYDFEKDQSFELFEDEQLSKLKKDLISIQHQYFNSTSKKKGKKLQKELHEKVNNIINIKSKKETNQNFLSLIEERNFFLWKIFFIDVFDNGGFDLVIGNPPYVFARSSGLKELTSVDKKYYVEKFKLTEYQINLYSLFVELGANILNHHGVLCFIIPNNWMTIQSNKDLRKFILEKNRIEIVEFSKKVFKNADVDVAILNFSNNSNQENYISLYKEQNNSIFLSSKCKANILRDDDFDFIINHEIISNPQFKKVIQSINKSSNSLSPFFAKCKSGLMAYEKGKGNPQQTSKMINERIYHSLVKESKSHLKYLEGDNIKRYDFSWLNTYLKYGDCLAAPRSINLFTTKRILVRQIPSKPPYCISAHYFEDEYLNDRNSMNIIDFNIEPLIILGLLNSKLMSFWFLIRFAKLQRSLFPQFKINELEKFPIPKKIEKNIEIKLISLVNKKIINSSDNSLDNQIDQIVYKLYQLKNNEIELIENHLSSF